jgi:hypothetical protein
MNLIVGEGTYDPDENPDRLDSYRNRDRAHLDHAPVGSAAIDVLAKSHFTACGANYRIYFHDI